MSGGTEFFKQWLEGGEGQTPAVHDGEFAGISSALRAEAQYYADMAKGLEQSRLQSEQTLNRVTFATSGLTLNETDSRFDRIWTTEEGDSVKLKFMPYSPCIAFYIGSRSSIRKHFHLEDSNKNSYNPSSREELKLCRLKSLVDCKPGEKYKRFLLYKGIILNADIFKVSGHTCFYMTAECFDQQFGMKITSDIVLPFKDNYYHILVVCKKNPNDPQFSLSRIQKLIYPSFFRRICIEHPFFRARTLTSRIVKSLRFDDVLKEKPPYEDNEDDD